MLPRIEAREKLSAIEVAALAAGAGQPLEREKIFDALRASASGADARPAQSLDPGELAEMGIGAGETGVIETASIEEWLGVEVPSSSEAVGDENG
jgi:hypothetical protein